MDDARLQDRPLVEILRDRIAEACGADGCEAQGLGEDPRGIAERLLLSFELRLAWHGLRELVFAGVAAADAPPERVESLLGDAAPLAGWTEEERLEELRCRITLPYTGAGSRGLRTLPYQEIEGGPERVAGHLRLVEARYREWWGTLAQDAVRVFLRSNLTPGPPMAGPRAGRGPAGAAVGLDGVPR